MSVRGYFICIHSRFDVNLRKVCISGSFFELLDAELLKKWKLDGKKATITW